MEITLSKPPAGFKSTADWKLPKYGDFILRNGEAVLAKPSSVVTSREHVVLRKEHETPEQGEVWLLDGCPYIAARVAVNGYAFISLEDGNRYSDAHPDCKSIIQKWDEAEFAAATVEAYYKGKK